MTVTAQTRIEKVLMNSADNLSIDILWYDPEARKGKGVCKTSRIVINVPKRGNPKIVMQDDIKVITHDFRRPGENDETE